MADPEAIVSPDGQDSSSIIPITVISRNEFVQRGGEFYTKTAEVNPLLAELLGDVAGINGLLGIGFSETDSRLDITYIEEGNTGQAVSSGIIAAHERYNKRQKSEGEEVSVAWFVQAEEGFEEVVSRLSEHGFSLPDLPENKIHNSMVRGFIMDKAKFAAFFQFE